ncbi:MAG TPA: sigma 54-interacting transcriptional regulator [Gemmatimonadales bacterium]
MDDGFDIVARHLVECGFQVVEMWLPRLSGGTLVRVSERTDRESPGVRLTGTRSPALGRLRALERDVCWERWHVDGCEAGADRRARVAELRRAYGHLGCDGGEGLRCAVHLPDGRVGELRAVDVSGRRRAAFTVDLDLFTVNCLSRRLARCHGPQGPDALVLERLVGGAPPMSRLHQAIRQFSRVDGPALLVGERGTGKGLAARCLHILWAGNNDAFFPVSCSAVPESLAESELFGHRRGAFTGASRNREGLLLTAFRRNGGVLLDDIAEWPAAIQPKLLSALEERIISPLGSDELVSIGNGDGGRLRLYATSQVESLTRLRPDLRDRLATCVLELAPLRERRPDVLLLADRFVNEAGRGSTLKSLDGCSQAVLLQYDWPGNVRQLRNVLERAAALVPEGEGALPEYALVQAIEQEAFLERHGQNTTRAAPRTAPRTDHEPDRDLGGSWTERAQLGFPTLEEVQVKLIHRALEHSGGNITHAADLLGLKRATLQSRLRVLRRNGTDQLPPKAQH